MAAAPGPNAELIKAADEFAAAVKNFDGDAMAQMKLLKEADRLRFLLESPFDRMMKQWESTSVISALHLLVETGALEKMPQEGSVTPKEIAALINIEESAIARALRLCVMEGVAVETAPSTFAHNAKSLAYATPGMREFFRITIEQLKAYVKLPDYFKSHTQEDLFDLKKSPFAWAFGLEGLTYYEAISHNPDRFNMFNQTMTQMEKQVPILGMFPFSSMQAEVEAEPERPFVVDIGGNRGHCLVAIKSEAPNGFGAKMILQDREDVIGSLTKEDIPGIETMVYDFFTPQPVKNAHIYYLRRILHDFYEPVCVKLLKNIASAMGPTSRLIIADMILPDRTDMAGDMTIYWMDFSMMMLNGKEKTKAEFEEILSEAGMEIVKVWPFAFGTQANIECRLKRG
ncbi:o-methyltransferase-like protein [Mollisia scopiformis]|uniref:O-methyltransferas-like protein n=1 Tax=Mollisia scopiformis TaxID=149040 RepID=A0A194XE83_MOLSC|nr:o-methyltransferase-like protein [Mollisia scopiformis]KUJ18488.1 o-methyltransferas-like protein [Mollisia scopiformis]